MQNIAYDEAWFLGGGAGAGFIYQGLVRAAEEQGINTNNILLTGTSIAAFFARALAEGMTYEEAQTKLEKVDKKITRIMIPRFVEVCGSIFHRRPGFEDPKKLEDIANEVFEERTFKEFPNLNILVSDYETNRLIEMNHETYPDIPVNKAIAASAAIQPVFYPYTIDVGRGILTIKDGGDSYENPINKVIPVGYNGRIFSINLMDGHKVLQKAGTSSRSGKNPEPYREELDITELSPGISWYRFLQTGRKNREYLAEYGYPEFMKALTGYLPKRPIEQSKPF